MLSHGLIIEPRAYLFGDELSAGPEKYEAWHSNVKQVLHFDLNNEFVKCYLSPAFAGWLSEPAPATEPGYSSVSSNLCAS